MQVDSATSVVSINNSTVSGNTARGDVSYIGAIANFGTVNLTNSTVSNNEAGDDTGGIFNNRIFNIVNSTISGNRATNADALNGGGIITYNGTTKLINSTITDNFSAGSGNASGIYIFGGAVNLQNTIVAGNQNNAANADVVGTAFTSNGYNLIGNSGTTTAFNQTGDRTGNSASPLDPQFMMLGNYGGKTKTHALLPTSPAIDAGSNALAVDKDNIPLTTDGRGKMRFADGDRNGTATADSGAYESGTVLTVTKLDDTSDGTCDGDCSLREAIAYANSTAADEVIGFNVTGTITLTAGLMFINDASSAGALTINGPDRSVGKVIVSGNNASGVFVNLPNTDTTINRLTITNGNSDSGGAIASFGSLTLMNSTLDNNTANAGGGLYDVGDSNIVNSTFSNNTATNGGGILNDGNTMTVVNSTVSGNSASLNGGGILSNSSATVINTTINGNSAGNLGGGLLIPNGVTDLENTIIANNTGEDCITDLGLTNASYIIVKDNSGATCINGTNSNNQFATTPYIFPLGNYGGDTFTHALSTANVSPAINSGDLASTVTTDQRGATRTDTVDIGSFEVNNSFIAELPNGRKSQAYDETIVPDATGYSYMVDNPANLPPGITLVADGNGYSLQGTPTTSGTYDFSITVTGSPMRPSGGVKTEQLLGAASYTQNYRIQVFAPTAASVSVGGRVLKAGRGIANAYVVLTDSHGETHTTRVSSFGYYRFDNVEVGQTVTIRVYSRRYSFAPQIFVVNEDITNLNFTAK